MHADRDGAAAFVFDMMEPERPKVDRAVLSFLKSEALHPTDFTIRQDGVVRLNPEMAKRVARLATRKSRILAFRVVIEAGSTRQPLKATMRLQYSYNKQGVLVASRAATSLGKPYLDGAAVVGGIAGFLMLLGSGSARAQSLWGGTGSTTTTSDYNTASNWSNPPGVAPVSPGTSALFANSGQATVNVSSSVDPNSWTFATNAQFYTITGSPVTFNTSAGLIDNANASQSITIGNSISGNAQLVLNGNSTLTLTADNSYSGPTTISSGTLQIGNGGQTGSIYFNSTVVGDVIDNGTLALNSSDATSLNATVSGTGKVSQIGGETIFYGGTYTGATTLREAGSRLPTGRSRRAHRSPITRHFGSIVTATRLRHSLGV